MFARNALRSSFKVAQSAPSSRFFSNSVALNKNVAVLGASGGIGQPVSILPILPSSYHYSISSHFN